MSWRYCTVVQIDTNHCAASLRQRRCDTVGLYDLSNGAIFNDLERTLCSDVVSPWGQALASKVQA